MKNGEDDDDGDDVDGESTVAPLIFSGVPFRAGLVEFGILEKLSDSSHLIITNLNRISESFSAISSVSPDGAASRKECAPCVWRIHVMCDPL